MKKDFGGKRSWHKRLAAAITAGLMTGFFVPGAMAAEYDQGLTGTDKDKSWLGSEIVNQDTNGNLIYTFKGDNTINAATGFKVGAYKTVTLDSDGTLYFKAKGSGISLTDGANVVINSNMDINSFGPGYGGTGIGMERGGTGTGDETHLTINGDVTMRNTADPENPWAVGSNDIHGGYANYKGSRWSPSAVRIGMTSGSTIDINGNVDIAVKGSGVTTDPYYKDYRDNDFDWTGSIVGPIKDPYKLAIVNLNGGNIRIETPESKDEAYFALANYGGTINVNMDGDKAGKYDVDIKGNILVMTSPDGNGGDPYFFQSGQINLALANANSVWSGVIDNSGSKQAGEVNLYLQNGATWNHKAMSMTNGLSVETMPGPSNNYYGKYDGVSHVYSFHGGSTAQNAGYIFQKDQAKIDIKNYSGHSVVFYEHAASGVNASDYAAGDIMIGSAAAGSGITLATDNTGITMSDDDMVAKVLNALAGKLTYSAYTKGETNLSGQVQIASGLTSSSAALKVGNIVFDETTGKGSNVDGGNIGGGDQTLTEFTQGITGVAANDGQYTTGGVLQADGRYVFEKDSSITMTGGIPAVDVQGNVVIDAAGSSLTLKADGDNNVYGISQSSVNKAEITADKVNIDVTSNSRAEGIHIMGSNKDQSADVVINGGLEANVKGSGYALGVYAGGNGSLTVNGNVIMKGTGENKWGVDDSGNGYGYYGSSALYAGSNYGIQKGGTINVNGSVDLVVNGNGAFANGGGSTINIGGGSIEINGERQLYALLAQSGYVNMNMNEAKDGAGTNKVNIKGNIGVLNGSAHSSEPCKESIINLGLSTKDSTWTGVIDNNFTEANKGNGFDGKVNLWLQNGATWTNEAYGTTVSGFSGSTVDNFVGGASAAKAGNIFQKDSNKLTINNYSGYTNIYYAHDNAGTTAEDYKAGDTVVKNAATGSGVTLITDNSGIKMSQPDQVAQVLNALAGKLTYSGYQTDPDNLTGKVAIASGLTSSGVTLKVDDITFDSAGKGTYEGEGIPDHQIDTEFAGPLTGVYDNDTVYVANGILKKDGTYKFEKDTTINYVLKEYKANPAAIDVEKDLVIDASGQNLTINVDNGDNYGGTRAIQINDQGARQATINADTLIISTGGKGSKSAGILVEKLKDAASENKGQLVLNSDVWVKKIDDRTGYAYKAVAVNAVGNSEITVNGDVKVKGEDGSYVINGNDNGYVGWQESAALVAEKGYGQIGGQLTVDGDVDIYVQGSGVVAQKGGAQVDINGGGTIVVKKDSKSAFYALGAEDGTVNMNMQTGEAKAANHDVTIKGNLYSTNNGVVNLGLSTGDSSLTGVAFNKSGSGAINLYMKNGAVWTNEVYNTIKSFNGSHINNFVGGSDASRRGYIFQKDSNDLTIDQYSGNTVVFYEHTLADGNKVSFAAGDTVIGSAAAGSEIVMTTDNSGIKMSDDEMVADVLNTLASKLVYSAYANGVEDNLSGKVQIASGLTSSSIGLKVGDIVFDSTTGRGSTADNIGDVDVPEHQVNSEFKTAITGDKWEDIEYLQNGVIKADGSYVFEKDSNITISGTGTPAVDVQGDVVIDAEGSSLTLKADGENNVYGISQSSGNKAEITAGKVNITATSGSRAEGIHVANSNPEIRPELTINGDVEISVTGTTNTIGAYVQGNSILNINGDVKMTIDGNNGGWGYYGASGLYATSNMGANSMGATINVDGNVDIKGNANGIFVNAGGSTVTVGGGRIEVDSSKNNYSAIRAENGVVNMNVQVDKNGKVTGAGTNDVNIKGNVAVTTGAVNGNDKNGTLSQVNLGLTTQGSTLNGVIYNAFPEDGKVSGGLTFKGEANLWLQNGATWTNEVSGTMDEGFAGSKVDNFTGGESTAKAGNIFQKDSNKLTINNYSGYTNIYYAHDNAGTTAADYKAGDTVVKHAAAGSSISLITDNSNIDMKSTEAIEATLSALSKKLVYEGAESNLEGKVQIASGLTASSVALQVGDIEFGADGTGGYVEGSVTSGVEYGEEESHIMKGARSAMMTSMLAWRDNAADMYSRAVDLRTGAEEGIWVRTFGGQSEYDGNKVKIENSYWAGQVGYDRTLANGWRLGAAIDYQDGNASYSLAGKGDNTLYSFGVYGFKDLGGNDYIDLAVKAGRVENDFEVYNEIGQKLTGDYASRGYSMTAQYGKRFGDTAKGYIEPQLQLTWAHLDSKNYNAYSGSNVMNIDQDAFDSFVGRIGIQAGQASKHGNIYARLSLAHEFAGDVEGRYNADDGGLKTTKYDLGGTWSELTLGGSYKLSKCSNFYADITRSLSGDYQHQWKLNAGLLFSF